VKLQEDGMQFFIDGRLSSDHKWPEALRSAADNFGVSARQTPSWGCSRRQLCGKGVAIDLCDAPGILKKALRVISTRRPAAALR
jgi:hypothetical protein